MAEDVKESEIYILSLPVFSDSDSNDAKEDSNDAKFTP